MGTDRILDAALIHSLSALKLGRQYVALTPKACQKINMQREERLSETDREKRQLCDIQGRLFELALRNGYDCPSFISSFMNSQAAAALDVTMAIDNLKEIYRQKCSKKHG